jgi:hypothetical protein
MNKIGIVAVSMLLGVFAAGCGNGGGGASCDEKGQGMHVCVTFDSSVDSTAADTECTAVSGTAVDSCPTANKLGDCELTSGGFKETESWYSDGTSSLTADQAKTSCEAAKGTWTAAK